MEEGLDTPFSTKKNKGKVGGASGPVGNHATDVARKNEGPFIDPLKTGG